LKLVGGQELNTGETLRLFPEATNTHGLYQKTVCDR